MGLVKENRIGKPGNVERLQLQLSNSATYTLDSDIDFLFGYQPPFTKTNIIFLKGTDFSFFVDFYQKNDSVTSFRLNLDFWYTIETNNGFYHREQKFIEGIHSGGDCAFDRLRQTFTLPFYLPAGSGFTDLYFFAVRASPTNNSVCPTPRLKVETELKSIKY